MVSQSSRASSRPVLPPESTLAPTASTRRLTVFYIASLSAIAGLAIVGQLLVQHALKQQELDIQVVSEVQQQKTLVSQMTRTAILMDVGNNTATQAEYAEELAEAIAQSNAWQQTMGNLATDPRLSHSRRQQIQRIVDQLAPMQQRLLSLAQQAMTEHHAESDSQPAGQRPGYRQALINARQLPEQATQQERPRLLEQRFVRELDALMLDYNQQVAASTRYLKRLELGLLAVTLGVLVLEGVFVFRPAVRQIREAMGALATSLQKTQAMAKRLDQEQQKSEKLLLNILPQPVARRLKERQQAIADGFAEVSVLFADIVGFTQISTTMPPQQLVGLLNEIFSRFDELAERHGLEKIKTIGDAYMVVGGLPTPRADHAEAIVAMAIDMQGAIATFNQNNNQSFEIRIGINSGPVVAGVIGIKKFIYDLWGDTVNTASRMESHGVPGGIHITDSTYQRIQHRYHAESQGIMPIKGKGEMETYLVMGLKGEARVEVTPVQKV